MKMRAAVWSIVAYLVVFVASLYFMDYYNVSFVAMLSAVLMFPQFAIEWILNLDVIKFINEVRTPAMVLIVGLLFVWIVGKVNFRIKPPEKKDD